MCSKSEIGDRLRIFREEGVKLTQGEFATAIKINRNTLIKIEQGRVSPTAALLSDIIIKFDLNINWLFSGKGYFKQKIHDYIINGESPELIETIRNFRSYPDFMQEEMRNNLLRIIIALGLDL